MAEIREDHAPFPKLIGQLERCGTPAQLRRPTLSGRGLVDDLAP